MADEAPERPRKESGLLDAMDDLERKRKARKKVVKDDKDLDLDRVWS